MPYAHLVWYKVAQNSLLLFYTLENTQSAVTMIYLHVDNTFLASLLALLDAIFVHVCTVQEMGIYICIYAMQ